MQRNPYWPLIVFDALKFLRVKVFTYCSNQEVGFRPKFRGADGKPKFRRILNWVGMLTIR
jgi:hypothetical protein